MVSRLRQLLQRQGRARVVPLVRVHLNANFSGAAGGPERREPSMEGLLVARLAGDYVLEHARLLLSEADTVALEGAQHVPARCVAWMQVLGDGELPA